MARKLPLETVTFDNPLSGQPARFDYGEVLIQILQLSSPGQGLTLDEVEQVMDAVAPIRKAIEMGEDSVTLTETQYRTLTERLARFQFSFATAEIAAFGRMVRDAPEIGTEATPLKRGVG